MRSCTLIIVLSAAALAAGSIPPRKQFLLNQNLDLLENPAKNINTLKPTNTPRFFVDPVDKVAYRLSNNTYPIHYDINIKTHVHKADFAFSGKVKIEIAVRVATSSIQIHHRQLTIGNVDLLNSQGVVIVPNIATSYRPIEEFLNIPVPQLIVGQIYYLEIEFTGELRGDNGGFYKSSYKNPQGHEVWLATTQFESTDARHGFPCYDEPSIRAQYTISIEHHANYTAISNMPQESRLAGGEPEYVITKFEKSLKFQTYLVAYVISDFKYIENLTAVPPQRVFATHTQIEDREADFALEFGVKVVEKLENHLGVKYIMPKLDQISMPDFAAGAMENFGN